MLRLDLSSFSPFGLLGDDIFCIHNWLSWHQHHQCLQSIFSAMTLSVSTIIHHSPLIILLFLAPPGISSRVFPNMFPSLFPTQSRFHSCLSLHYLDAVFEHLLNTRALLVNHSQTLVNPYGCPLFPFNSSTMRNG